MPIANTKSARRALGTLLLLGAGCGGPGYSTRPDALPAPRGSDQTLAIVRVARPWYAPAALVRSRFHDAVPEYEGYKPLDSKFFILTDDGRFGGIYLWRSRADADAFYSEAWRRGIRERRGADADLLLFQVRTVLEGRALPRGEPLGARSQAYPASATLALWNRGPEAEAFPPTIPPDSPGLIRAFTIGSDAQVGLVALWATRAQADASLARGRLAGPGEPAVRGVFEAPVLLDADLRASR
jgi:hypothetical protein